MKPSSKLGLFLLLLASTLHSSAQPLVSSNTTVILLVGLPGDLPSERTYRAQTEAWLEWLAGLPQLPRRVHLLWDTDPVPVSPPRLAIKTLPSRRDPFLRLADELNGSDDPVLLVAWGHGGAQRTTPVLHVRGPRLTPRDFQRLTQPASGPPCVGILMFRGSGQFASILARQGLSMLTSEHEVAFHSDPIGMELLLQSLQPETQLQDLGRALGNATVAWYESRQLARTEEPTLWIDTDVPVRLAQTPPAVEPAVGPHAAPPGFAAEPASAAPGPGAERWADVEPVHDYPGWDAVVLRHRLSYTIATEPAVVAEQEIFLQILTPQGVHHADFSFSYSPPAEEFTVLEAEIRQPDGQILRLDPAAIHESIAPVELGYTSQRQKFFSLPGAAPGAVLHVRHRSTWKEFPMPHVSLQIPIPLELPLRQLSLQVEVPRTCPLHFRFQELTPPDPSVIQGEYGTRHTWQITDLSPAPHQLLSHPNRTPSLLLSTWPDWVHFASWYDRISRLADTQTAEIEQTALHLTAGAESEEEKVIALYNYVTGLRYVAVPLGVNSFRPHAAANVLKNQFGDCKDKANLFNALLRSLQIDAHLVLVPRFTQAYPELPGFAFNHAISRVSLADRMLWIDTTDDLCRFGLLPPGDPGRAVLVVDGQTKGLDVLPRPAPGDHTLSLNARIDLRLPDQPSQVTWSAQARGFPDYALRNIARQRTSRHPAPLINNSLTLMAGLFVCTNQTFTPFSDLATPFAWKAQGRMSGLLAQLPNQFLLQAPFWLPADWDQALYPRSAPLFLNHGYPLQLRQIVAFHLEEQPRPIPETTLPSPHAQPDPPLKWRLSWNQPTPESLVASLDLELIAGELDMADTTRFQTQLQSLYDALSTGVLFKP